jgi:hypothetical protein
MFLLFAFFNLHYWKEYKNPKLLTKHQDSKNDLFSLSEFNCHVKPGRLSANISARFAFLCLCFSQSFQDA